MTMQAEQFIGARVTSGDGQVAGTVQQIYYDDRDGRPMWARIRAGTRDRFVPLAGCQVTKDGLRVPYDTRQIMSSPEIGADRHISSAQTDQLQRHYGLTVPAQAGEPRRGEARPGDARPGPAEPGEPLGQGQPEARAGEARLGETERGEEWLIRAEERVEVGTEMLESGRARLHKYVDVEPVDQAVRVFHEEYKVERVPITAEEHIPGVFSEAEQEIVLHEERPVFRKEAVPVERVRLAVKRVPEERTIHDEIRKERIEVEGNAPGKGL
jgi:stress response protein YsnF